MLIQKLALKYLLGGKSLNAVPILSRISMIAIAVGSCAMIVLFSVFNGFDGLIKELYKAFYPEIKITTTRGKFFSLTPDTMDSIRHLDGVMQMTRVLEDNVLLSNGEDQQVARLKGVDKQYTEVNNLAQYMYDGNADINEGRHQENAIVGLHLANKLGLDVHNAFSWFTVYYPNTAAANLTTAFHSLLLRPTGIFRVQDEFDDTYVLASLNAVQELFAQPGKMSSLEISLLEGADPHRVKRNLQTILGDAYRVETRYEQNKTLYMVMQAEKWAVYAILVLVLWIASFNMTGALTMLVLEKQKDISILKAMGAEAATLRKLFITEGVLWSFLGGLLGIITGTLLCWGQQKFHWVTLEGAFIIDAYPVTLRFGDCLIVICTVVVIGLLASVFPARKAAKTAGVSLSIS